MAHLLHTSFISLPVRRTTASSVDKGAVIMPLRLRSRPLRLLLPFLLLSLLVLGHSECRNYVFNLVGGQEPEVQ